MAGKEYSFEILKNYPSERAYVIIKQAEASIVEKLFKIVRKR